METLQIGPVDVIEIGYTNAPGPPGPTGASGGSYVHVQTTPAMTWAITHTLGYLPNVAILDVDGNLIDAAISWPTATTITVTFSATTAGRALLS